MIFLKETSKNPLQSFLCMVKYLLEWVTTFITQYSAGTST